MIARRVVTTRPPRVAFGYAVLLVALLLPLPTCAGTRAVTVTGWGALEGDGVAEARARAVTDALGRAVQAGGRTVVNSETRLANDWELTSNVAAQTLGVIRGYRILEEGADPGRGYRVKLVAQVTTGDQAGATMTDAARPTKVLVIAREQYRGRHTPSQVLASELARKVREKGLVAALGSWRAPLVTLAGGELRVSAEHLREAAAKHEVDSVLIAWAEARHSDSANPSLHSARALGKVHVYAGASGELVGVRTVPEVLGWGPTPERAGDAALAEVRKSLGAQGVLLVIGATRPR